MPPFTPLHEPNAAQRRYYPRAVLKLAAQGLVKLNPEPYGDGSRFESSAAPLQPGNSVMLGRHRVHHATAAAVRELLALPEIPHGEIQACAARHRAPYQRVHQLVTELRVTKIPAE